MRSFATVTENRPLESGSTLREGTVVLAWREVDGWYGITWRDNEGTHSMAIEGRYLRFGK